MKRLIVLAAVVAGVLMASLASDASAGWRRGYYGPGWRRGYSYSYGYPGYYSGYYRYPAYGYYGRPGVVVQTPGFVYRSGPAYYGGYYYGSPYSGGYYW